MKAFVKLLTVLVLLSMLVSCAPKATEPPAAELTAAEQWAKTNGVGPYQPATDDWAAIEAAAKLEGKGVVYANSGGVEDLPDAWNALYPDIELDAADTDGIDYVCGHHPGEFPEDVGLLAELARSRKVGIANVVAKVWITKYRYPVLVGDVGERARELLRQIAKSGDDDLLGCDQPGSCAYADRDTAASVGIEGGAVSEGEEFASDALGVCDIAQALLGSTFVGSGLLGCDEW